MCVMLNQTRLPDNLQKPTPNGSPNGRTAVKPRGKIFSKPKILVAKIHPGGASKNTRSEVYGDCGVDNHSSWRRGRGDDALDYAWYF